MACNCLTDEPTNCVPSWSKCPTVWPRKWRVETKRSGGEEQCKMVETSQGLSQKFAHPCTSMEEMLHVQLNQSCSQVDDMSHISTVHQYMHAFTKPLTFFKSSSCTKWLGRWAGGHNGLVIHFSGLEWKNHLPNLDFGFVCDFSEVYHG